MNRPTLIIKNITFRMPFIVSFQQSGRKVRNHRGYRLNKRGIFSHARLQQTQNIAHIS
ncbi:hypothetical protein BN59_01543 [Legionella massiliensis]|uniref:Uncharacterized protein n=1 Tax=Legionella massiliensis TaxID=1034943 RepID=A0A078KW88_9GAMM|nr:hypothetical protein BN59_01543 [Legionella massiliensis]CEE12999.1 hypothetical protein BN1094_01543 [Legionella massiliensis]